MGNNAYRLRVRCSIRTDRHIVTYAVAMDHCGDGGAEPDWNEHRRLRDSQAQMRLNGRNCRSDPNSTAWKWFQNRCIGGRRAPLQRLLDGFSRVSPILRGWMQSCASIAHSFKQRSLTLGGAFTFWLRSIQRVKTLHRYLLRQIIATLFMTVAVFTFVLLLGNVLTGVLPLLMSQKANLGTVFRVFGLLIPWVSVFALPMGLLTATLLVFGRFSADQEYTAARASGLSLVSLAMPVLILSLLLSVLSAAFNLDFGPRSRIAFKQLRFNLLANLATLQLPEGRPVEFDAGDGTAATYTITVGKNRRQQLEDVRVFRVMNDTNLEMVATAPRGQIELDSPKRLVTLRLYNAQFIYVQSGLPFAGNFSVELMFDPAKEKKSASITDMTFADLRSEMAALESRIGTALSTNTAAAMETNARKQQAKKELADLTQPYRVQMHRRAAFSFACFSFALVGIPLGIRVHRRETNIGIGIALLLVAAYYGLLIAAESLTNRPEFAPHLLVWLPNFLFQAVGAVLLWRANRGV